MMINHPDINLTHLLARSIIIVFSNTIISKRFLRFGCALLIPLFFTFQIMGQTDNTVVNINGDFRDAEPGIITSSDAITNWTLLGMDYADYEILPDSLDESNRILQVSVPVNDGSLDPWAAQALHSNISVQTDKRYTVALRVKIDAITTPRIQMHPQGLGANQVALYGYQVEPGAWTVIETSAFQPSAEGDILVALHFTHPDNPDNVTYYIDWLEVRETVPLIPPPSNIPLAAGHDTFLGSIGTRLTYWEYYWNQLTPENAGKWGSVEPQQGVRNWATLDAKYQFAKDLGVPFRFHVLLWGSQQPGWIEDLSEADQLSAIEDWFNAVAERYPDIDYLEVLNEQLPGHGGLPYMDALGGPGETGWDWIINAFQMARDIFPETARLMINDYGILGVSHNTQLYLEIIGLLQERDLIDGIGVQGHHFTIQGGPFNPRPSVASIKQSLDLLGATGLPIQVTEMDIGGNPMQINMTEEESDQYQLEEYQRLFPVIWEHPSVEGITTWGFRPPIWAQNVEAHLVRDDGSERPAMQWLRQYLDTLTVSVGDGDIADLPHEYKLYKNYPNPFNPSTNIRFNIGESAHVTLTVYDVLGRFVETIVDEYMTPGQYDYTFTPRDLSSGVYIYRLQAGSFVEVKRMVFLQ